jgi:lipopolysaccharide/colanic/teichoic acid biosynthesis glycosyltransferase
MRTGLAATGRDGQAAAGAALRPLDDAGGNAPRRPARQADLAKRGLDVGVALLLLLLLLPVLAAAAAMVRLSSPGPVLLRQVRIGRHEVPFEMLKFRTMYVGVDDGRQRSMNERELRGERDTGCGDGVFKLRDDPRVTPAGRWLRRFSIDELPQLFNVIRGDMSLVGPRPSLPWEVELYTSEQRRRHECLPGISGLWQVSGRNRVSMPEMLELDLEYLRTRSLALDLWIMARTPAAVLLDRSVR